MMTAEHFEQRVDKTRKTDDPPKRRCREEILRMMEEVGHEAELMAWDDYGANGLGLGLMRDGYDEMEGEICAVDPLEWVDVLGALVGYWCWGGVVRVGMALLGHEGEVAR
jgi:hypothetical protein